METIRRQKMANDYKYTAYFNTLHDKYARLDLQQEQLVDLVADKYSDQKDRRPVGRVIQAELRSDGFVRAFIRIPKIHDHCIDEACEFQGNKGHILKFNHISAISKQKVDTTNADPAVASSAAVPGTSDNPAAATEYVGRDVYVEFVDGGPDERGKLRSARFELKTFQDVFGSDSRSCFSSGGDEVDWTSIAFTNGDVLGDADKNTIELSKQPLTSKKNYTLATIDKTYFYNRGGQAIMAIADDRSKVEGGPPGKLTNEKPSSDLIHGWLAAVVKLVNFHVIVTSAIRGPRGQATAEYNKLAAGDVSVYSESYQKYLNKVYADCRSDSRGQRECTIDTLEDYHKRRTPKGHGTGTSVDIRTTSWLTQPQTKYMLQIGQLMGARSGILEPNPPHLHFSIASYGRLKNAAGDAFDPAKVAAKIKEWDDLVAAELEKHKAGSPSILDKMPAHTTAPATTTP